MTAPEYTWTDDSALWQVKHGELTSDRTESAFRHLAATITENSLRPSVVQSLAHNLLDTIRELRGRAIGHYDISREDWKTITRIPAPDSEPAPDPAARAEILERTIELLLAYGTARFGDEWWPGNARHHMPDGRELEYLLDPGSAEQADREGAIDWRVYDRDQP
jgi:hypothetical protein